MEVKIELKETSQAIVYNDVSNTYTKGSLYCVYVDGMVYKYPLDNIWRVSETYKKPTGFLATMTEDQKAKVLDSMLPEYNKLSGGKGSIEYGI